MGVRPTLGDIMAFPYDFVPPGWAACDGQLLAIAQNTALFSVLGTVYGGDGRTTFALPDLRGRLPLHAGSGPGLTEHKLGQRGGVETVPLSIDQMGSHNHQAMVVNSRPDSNAPSARVAASNGQGRGAGIYREGAGTGTLAGLREARGGSKPHTNMMPSLALTVCIAIEGTYPSRGRDGD